MKKGDLRAFGLEIPKSYRAMHDAGLLSYGKGRADWQKNWKTIVTKAPPALMGCDVEWLAASDVVGFAKEQGGRPRWRADWPADFVFVAFAQTGAGDEFGWAPTLRGDAADVPVVYIEHDSDAARIVAPSFEAFLFRMAMQAFTHQDLDPDELSLAATVAMLRKSAKAVLPYLPKPQRTWLENVIARPVREVHEYRLIEKRGTFVRGEMDMHLTVLDAKLAERLVERALAYPRLDEAISF